MSEQKRIPVMDGWQPSKADLEQIRGYQPSSGESSGGAELGYQPTPSAGNSQPTAGMPPKKR